MTRRGLLVALSGVDSAGKSTQREPLLDALRSLGYEPITLWTRAGYTPGIESAKALVNRLRGRKKAPRGEAVSDKPSRYPRRAANLGHPLKRRLWLTCALLDLLWTYGVRVRSWRSRGRAVVCDRYLLDCLVDFRVNFPDDDVEHGFLGRYLRRFSPKPDVAFCLVIPAELSMERSRGKSRFHWETTDVLEQRWQAYTDASGELGVQRIDGSLPREEIARTLRRAVSDVLPEAGVQPERSRAAGER